jgi:hypothetical protein
MDKIKLVFKTPEEKTLEHNGISFTVIPFLSVGQQTVLINNYLNDYFGENPNPLVQGTKYNYLEAEYKLMNYILQGNTNIDAAEFDDNMYADSDFFEKITSEIANYEDFRYKLEYIIEDIKEQFTLTNSVGTVLSGLAGQLSGFLDSIKDIKPEDIERMQQETANLAKTLEESSILNNNQKPKIPDEVAKEMAKKALGK